MNCVGYLEEHLPLVCFLQKYLMCIYICVCVCCTCACFPVCVRINWHYPNTADRHVSVCVCICICNVFLCMYWCTCTQIDLFIDVHLCVVSVWHVCKYISTSIYVGSV